MSVTSYGRVLADQIVGQSSAKYAAKICQNEAFYNDPTAHLINEMIQRGVGRCRMDDGARSTVISMIPDFLEKAGSPEYLKNFAVQYFKENPQAEKIQAVFEKSINTDAFKTDLSHAVTQYKNKEFHDAEDNFRIALTVFDQAKHLEIYRYPENASQE